MSRLLTGATALFTLASLSWADTLALRNGQQQNGRFVSGSGTSITFQTDDGKRHVYSLREVQSIQFESQPAAAIRTDNSGRVTTADTTNRTIPANTDLVVRTNEAINADSAAEGRTYSANVDRDIVDRSGNVLVPRGSDAELIVRKVEEGGATGSPEMVLDLQSIKVGDQRYLVSAADLTRGGDTGLGRNRRTATMVGGGAVLGSVLGAIAGGGKGAAIGAIAGAAAGAGAQVLTRGREVKVPAETVLTFRLDKPVQLVPERR